MRYPTITRTALLLAGCLCSGFLVAQSPDSVVLNLDEVVVTATRTEKSLSESGRSVSVISREQIEQSAALSVADLLSRTEGIYVVGNGQTPGANQSIFLRGANSNQVAILLDGVRISDASTVNNTIDLSELSLHDVDRIEIARGAQGTLYGQPAIGGVINIITRRAHDPGFSGRLLLQGGTFGPSTGTGEVAAEAGYVGKKGLFVTGFYDRLRVEGLDATVDTVTDPNVFKNRDQDGWDKTSAGISAGLENKQWALRGSYRSLDMKTDLDNGAYSDDDNYTLDFNRDLVQGSAVFSPDSVWQLSLTASFSETDRIARDDSSVISTSGETDHTYLEDHYSGEQTAMEFTVRSRLKHAEFIGGYSFLDEAMNQSSYYFSPFYSSQSDLDALDPHINMNSFFLHGDFSGSLLSPSLRDFNLVAGARLYAHTFFSNKITAEINPTLRLGENSLLSFSYSGGYNVPSLYQLYAPEMYVTYDNGFTTGLTRGNKSLRPETSATLEFGIRQTVSDRFAFSVFLFRTRTENLIDYAYLWNGSVPIDSLATDFTRDDFRGDRYLNAGTLVSEGMEIAVTARLHAQLVLRANVTLAGGHTEFSPGGFDSSETGGSHVQLFSNGVFLDKNTTLVGLVRRPSTANLQLSYAPVPPILVSCMFQYTGLRSDVYYDSSLGPYGAQNTKGIGSYSLTTLEASYAINRHFAITGRLENIFDEEYQEIYGFTSRGRGGYLKLIARW